MKALVLQNKKELPVLTDVKQPNIQSGETLVEVTAAALNHRDVWITKGLYPGINPPVILGSDACGIVDGKKVIINPSLEWGTDERFPSDKYSIVGLPTDGTFAEYIAVSTKNIHPKPTHLTDVEAAALPLAGLTAYRAVFTKGQLKNGQKILISGIGGGVALLAMQFAIAAGAEVYVTSSSDEKIGKAIEMGAKGGVNYKNENWISDLKELSKGLDVIIDSAAGEGLGALLKCCNFGARIAIYGGTRGVAPINPQILFWKQITLLGTSMGSDGDFAAMLNFVNQHKIKPIVHKTFSLEEGPAAFGYLDSGQQLGKIVIEIKK